MARVFHSELWGRRQEKYDWLTGHDHASTDWEQITPHEEFYLFLPRDEAGLETYQCFAPVTTVFPLNGAGMTTARDSVVIDIDRAKLLNRIRQFKHSRLPDGQLHEVFQIRRKKGWDIRRAWEMLQDMTDSEVGKHTVRVLYRPFDVRWIFYHDSLVWRTAKRVMRHMLRT